MRGETKRQSESPKTSAHKRLLEQPVNVVQLDFLETHPLIRPLEAYRIGPAGTFNPTPTP